MEIALSALDEARFGIRVARAANIEGGHVADILAYCQQNAVQMLIARCAVDHIHHAQMLEQSGFLLMDTLVYYKRDVLKKAIPADPNPLSIRSVRIGDEAAVRRVAEGAFRGYAGHYHADPRLERAKCDETYIDWAVRSCLDRNVAAEVLIAETNDSIVGFATLRLNTTEEGEGVLFGVAPEAQGKGIYRAFILEGMRWCAASGAHQMVVSTQVNNIAVQKVWVRLGFEPSYAYYTFHKWFD
ncbi:MAG TPA: GNAT family N-acetyltransferase [Aggregatilineales bacterium]|nr:GNAT family N-acetyltransferase [Anaerolineales bacterium]HRE48721.1 GNAT family N-acetyltransferase [Aggregatilineales bacterium]